MKASPSRSPHRDHRLGEPLPRRIAILRALKLGDLLCAVPAFRALCAALPDAEIVLIGLPWARTFAKRFRSYLDGFREFPGYPGLPEQPAAWDSVPDFLAMMQSERFDLVLQMHVLCAWRLLPRSQAIHGLAAARSGSQALPGPA